MITRADFVIVDGESVPAVRDRGEADADITASEQRLDKTPAYTYDENSLGEGWANRWNYTATGKNASATPLRRRPRRRYGMWRRHGGGSQRDRVV